MVSVQFSHEQAVDVKQHPENPFWQFSLAVYGRAGVPQACLGLQASHGADVNLLLYVCWLSSRGIAGSLDDIRLAAASVEGWHRDVVVALRRVRTGLKAGYAGLDPDIGEPYREKVKRAELEAEQIEQAILYALPLSRRPADSSGTDREALCRSALSACLAEWSDVPGDANFIRTIAAAAVSG